MGLNIHLRHLLSCPHRDRRWNFVECYCPVWADGMIDGKRIKRSLRTTDWGEAVELAQLLLIT
jgi:hypothetical protein